MKNFAMALLASVLASGCVMVDLGYTANEDVRRHAVSTPQKVDITYSVSFDQLRGDFIASPQKKDIIEALRDKLAETGLFRSVSYSENPTDYHVMFKFFLWGELEKDSQDLTFASIALGCAIPIWQDMYFDGSAQLYLKNIQVASSAHAEVLRNFVWLPCLPFGCIWNAWTGWSMVGDGVLNALINDISGEHSRRFLR